MIITISGAIGSGKSTIARAIAEKYKLKQFSAGDFMRAMAKEKGMTLLELSKIAEKGDEVDKDIDERTKKLAAEEDNFILDSRIGWYFIPEAIKIYLKVDADEGAKRVFKRQQQGDEDNITLEKTKENILRREKSEIERYKNYYGIDLQDESNYDFVLDTTKLTAKKAIKKVLDWLETRFAKQSISK